MSSANPPAATGCGQRRRHPALAPVCLLAIGLGLIPGAPQAQIRTDASLGRPAQALSGPNFLIPESLGKLAGGNLFHSFQTFNLAAGESASFTTTSAAIGNVISRVTGGEVSHIHGRISLKPVSGTPAFIFINPAGIVFGDGARIDVPGAFHAATADHVTFADGSRYAADPGAASSFASAAPAAFGFLGKQAALLSLVNGASLVALPRQTVTLAGGDLLIEQAGVYADGGDLRLATSGRRAQEVPFSGALTQGAGTLAIHDGGVVSVSTSTSNRSGSIRIQTGELLIDRMGYPDAAGIYGRALGGSGGGAQIEIAASQSVTLRDGGLIRLDSKTNAPSGSLHIASPLVGLDNAYISADSYGTGQAGSIRIDAQRIVLGHGGQIVATAQSSGPAGNIALAASEAIEISGRDPDGFRSGLFVLTLGKAPAGNVELNAPKIVIRDDGLVSGYAYGNMASATAGHIRITGGELRLENGGKITVEGYDSMGMGSVTVKLTGRLLIVGKGEERNVNPGSDTVSTGILGHANTVSIDAPEITVTDSGAIRSESWYQTTPGRIDINTQRLTLQSGGHISGSALGHSYTYGVGAPIVINAGEFVHISGISTHGRASIIESGARSSGGSGSIAISTPWLRLSDHGIINTGTGVFGTAGAGQIDIAVDRLEVVEGGRIASTENGHAARGAHIVITARQSALFDDGELLAWGSSEGSAGKITLKAPILILRNNSIITTTNYDSALSGGIEISATDMLLGGGSKIESSSTSSRGAGSIQLRIGGTLNLDNSTITTTSDYAGGGNISINGADAIRLSRSLITTSVTGTNYAGVGGGGGDIQIGARSLALDNGFIQANTVARDARGGNIGIAVDLLVASSNHLLLGGQTPHTFKPGVAGFNVIQAAAPTGLSGTIDISSPALDLSGSVLALSAQMIDPGGLGRSPCQPTGGSSLVQTGRGGFAPAGRDLLDPRALSGGLPNAPASATAPSPGGGTLTFNPLPCSRG